MGYETQLQFAGDLLKGLHISSSILSPGHIGPEVDLGLRAMLFGREDYCDILENSLLSAEDHTIYRFFDEYGCNYIFMKLPGADRYFFMGPYLLGTADRDQIAGLAGRLDLPEHMCRQLSVYYASLPIVEDENWLLILANTLGRHLWGADTPFEMEYVDYMIPDRSDPISVVSTGAQSGEAPLSLAALERNYANEKLLMDAVSHGKLHLITAVASSVFTNGTEARSSDSLRDRKNYLIILNTLLRKAAEEGGVHPLHIHHQSSLFARQVEQLRSIRESLTLQTEMIRSYCVLVRQRSLREFSFYVARAITLIQFDLTADLSLKAIAAELNVNPSYLSNLFHKECGCTLTEYVNRQRIERAVTLLEKRQKNVQDIAADCGVQDANYFIKLFKKHTGMTPRQYRNMYHSVPGYGRSNEE